MRSSGFFCLQCVVFAGQLNSITSLVTVFYLLAYAAVDLACLALEWASAPNFRYLLHCTFPLCLLYLFINLGRVTFDSCAALSVDVSHSVCIPPATSSLRVGFALSLCISA